MIPAVVNGKRLPIWRNSSVYAKLYDKGADRLRHNEEYISHCYRLEITLRSKTIRTKKFMGRNITLKDMITVESVGEVFDGLNYFSLLPEFEEALERYYSDYISYFCHYSLAETREELFGPIAEFWEMYKWSPALARDSYPKTSYYRFVKDLRKLGYYSYVDRPDMCSIDPRPFSEYFSTPHPYLVL